MRPQVSGVLPSAVTRRSVLATAVGCAVAFGANRLLGDETAAGATASGPTAVTMPDPWSLNMGGAWVPTPAARIDDRVLRSWFRRLVVCGRRTIHVSGSGHDSGDGGAAAPLRQLSTAISRARPGDLIVVGSGEYGYTEIRGVHGDPSRWLGIMTASPDVRAVVHVPPPTDNFVNIVDSSFVGVFGLEVVGTQRNPNTNGSGISVYGNSHHVALWNNHVHDFPGGGINCFDVNGSHDLMDISYNRIHGTSRYSPNNTSGISVYASRDLTRGELLPGGYGYRIVGNYVYDVQCLVPFTPGGYDVVTDGNGISLDSIRSTHGYTKRILVAGNLITGCGGRGVLAYRTTNVDVRQNTAVGNLRTNSPAITGGVELEGKTDRSVRFLDNVICPLHTPNTTDAHSQYARNVVLGGSQPVPRGNVDARHLGLSYFTRASRASTISGTSTSSYGRRAS